MLHCTIDVVPVERHSCITTSYTPGTLLIQRPSDLSGGLWCVLRTMHWSVTAL